VTLSSLRGQVWLADIIFTRCLGPCPKMAQRTAELQKLLPAKLPVRFVTLTTDPEYDTPAVLRAHGARFGAVAGRWHFLTGSKKAIADLAVGGLKLTALDQDPADQKSPEDLFIHSTQFVLVDGAGRARAVFLNEDPAMTDKAVNAVHRLLAER
jgi:protein SCO1/2